MQYIVLKHHFRLNNGKNGFEIILYFSYYLVCKV